MSNKDLFLSLRQKQVTSTSLTQVATFQSMQKHCFRMKLYQQIFTPQHRAPLFSKIYSNANLKLAETGFKKFKFTQNFTKARLILLK